MLAEGTKAPAVSLPDQNGTMHSLAEYTGKWVLVYFYPKDDTSGCTKEACGIRDAWDDYEAKGIVVFGISKDSIESHKKFEEKYGLPFTLLADTDKKAIIAYDAGRGPFTARISYLIGPDGIIRKAYPSVDPAIHAPQILADFDALSR